MFVYTNDDSPTLVSICRNMVICDVFMQVAPIEIYPDSILFGTAKSTQRLRIIVNRLALLQFTFNTSSNDARSRA